MYLLDQLKGYAITGLIVIIVIAVIVITITNWFKNRRSVPGPITTTPIYPPNAIPDVDPINEDFKDESSDANKNIDDIKKQNEEHQEDVHNETDEFRESVLNNLDKIDGIEKEKIND